MRRRKISALSVEDLVEEFIWLAIEQDNAMLANAQSKINRLFWKLDAIMNELKSRPGDQRSVLLSLYGHENMNVRLKAAHATLALAPQAARTLLEEIAASGWQPQALDAGMSIINLDRGIYKPT